MQPKYGLTSICGVQGVYRQADRRTDRKVKTEDLQIIDIRYLPTLIIGGPIIILFKFVILSSDDFFYYPFIKLS